jgi:heat shock protein HslJ
VTVRGALLAATTVVMVACGDPAPPPSVAGLAPATLRGTTWQVAAVNGQHPNRAAIPFISFEADLIQGNGGCNGIFGQYEYDGIGGLDITELGSTERLCEARVSEFEARLLSALAEVSLAQVAFGQLVLLGRGVEIVLDPTDARRWDGPRGGWSTGSA